MIGILIIAHGSLGDSLIHCATHVMGERPPLLKQLGVSVHDDPVDLLPLARSMVSELNEDEGGGVLILSDIYGATPCNIASRLLEPGRVEGISGVNLPMLVRALSYRNEPLHVLLEKAMSGGTGGIIHMTEDICKS
ncbi:PTS system, ascorbate-specific IIA component [Novimethylophilus kurashikiensis]|uniref:PTS system, ascorbate-specific IIA component n=1 Tax=Novimethylophilus kurashikiensis TaxID=1825523 RepID=A0A2R5F5X0_9PROT|nr:PTS fructose transporter subunit IIA [Novimethylophilus kurashikiensis]GBG13667.1 PTS system, ascorbate-specific IIA component [Novimethylophilus kurashikiensis]